jgi:hypothetical protein
MGQRNPGFLFRFTGQKDTMGKDSLSSSLQTLGIEESFCDTRVSLCDL